MSPHWKCCVANSGWCSWLERWWEVTQGARGSTPGRLGPLRFLDQHLLFFKVPRPSSCT